MAMNQRVSAYNSRGTGSNRGRPQYTRQRLPATRPFYEDFRPVSEWKTENEAFILLVRLPGFMKEQINFSKDDSKRYIRINGERSLADHRRIRFNSSYTIPQNSNFNQITTHFDHGLLQITIPKLSNLTTTPNIPPQTQQGTTSQEKPTTKMQKSDEAISSFGSENQEKEVAGKTLSEKDSTSTGLDNHKKTEDKEMVIEGKLVSEEKNKNDVENSAEKQLVVNMCVAVMVIVGLGLELFTTFDFFPQGFAGKVFKEAGQIGVLGGGIGCG